jgi:hypothetical protein
MSAEKLRIKERRLITMTGYSVSKDKIEYDECGWSEAIS